jgi:membrane protein
MSYPDFYSKQKRLAHFNRLRVTTLSPRWWLAFGRMMTKRIRQQQLPQVASSLTFTTVLSLVPMMTVALAIFTAFPIFDRFRESLEGYLFASFLPETLSDTILGYVNQFSAKARSLTAVGMIALLVTALTTMFTVDKVFNQIWNVRRKRSLIKKILLYWAAITLSPLLIGVSLSLSSYLLKQSMFDTESIRPITAFLFTLTPMVCTVAAFALAYIAIPNRPVLVQDAIVGGALAALLFELAKRAFAYYITHFPAYTALYGALASFPIFLLWIYLSWIIVLLGATVAAALPIARTGHLDHIERPGERWIVTLAILHHLEKSRRQAQPGLTLDELRWMANIPPDLLDELLDVLTSRGIIGRIFFDGHSERYALICDPDNVSVEFVAEAVWLDRAVLLALGEEMGAATTQLSHLADTFLARPRLAEWLGEGGVKAPETNQPPAL